jgi:ParB family chromosome partitioning protein
MQSIVSVSPFRCRMWSMHDRLESAITEESCRAEMESFARHGQMIPVLGRVLRGDPTHDIELIYGARRLFVARQLNMPLKVELRELSDREAVIAMDIENRHRKDLSPYERGLSYAQFLREGYFASQDDIARTLKVSSSQVSRLLKLARMPSVIVEAFGSPIGICEAWGLDVLEALEDPQRRQATVQVARAIGKLTPRPAPLEVYKQLMAASAQGRKSRASVRDEVVRNRGGSPLFRIRRQTDSVTLLLPVERVSAKVLAGIRAAITDIISQRCDEQPAVVAAVRPHVLEPVKTASSSSNRR